MFAAPPNRTSAPLRARWAGLVLIAALLACGAGCRPDQMERPGANAPLHLVIDAGSSGTRLCLFAIRKICPDANGPCHCGAPPVESDRHPDGGPRPVCESIPDAGGLAGMSPAAAAAVLADALANRIPDHTRERIQNAALLGTGGFRQASPQKRRAILQSLSEQLRRSLPAASGWPETGAEQRPAARTLSGADEGRLAWLAMREIHGSVDHAVLETGGASVQFAVAMPLSESEAHATGAGDAEGVRSISLPLGMNSAFQRLQNDAELPACFPFGAADARTDFDRCRKLIRRQVFTQDAIAELQAMHSDSADGVLFGLGSSWKAIFAGMQKSRASLSNLQRFGRRICAARKLTEQERSSKYLQRRCYLYAYQSVLLEETGYREIRRGRESWARGAAISEEFFPACALPLQEPQQTL